MKKKVSLTIDETLWNEYNDYCEHEGYKKSTLVEKLIKDQMARG